MSILIIDDDMDLRGSIRDQLHACGYEAIDAPSAETAVEVLKETRCDLILLDLNLGRGMDGMDFLKIYKDVAPQAQVIVMTGNPSHRTAINALSGGSKASAVEYLTKPTPFPELLALVEKYTRYLQSGRFQVDVVQKIASYENEPFHTTNIEFRLLTCFLRYPDQVLTYETLAKYVYSEEMSHNLAKQRLRSHMSRLREKLSKLVGETMIDTQAGRGFVWVSQT